MHDIYIYVVSGGPPSNLGGPRLWFCGHFRQFCVNTLWTCCVQSVSLIFGRYITQEFHDVICDVMALHMQWSHDCLL